MTLQLNQDWPNEKNMANLAAKNPNAGVFAYRNIRLSSRTSSIASAFIERFITDPSPILHTTGSGKPTPVRNHFVVSMSTNEGAVSEDLENRSLKMMLVSNGDTAERKSPIGDPRYEYLPQNRRAIHAVLMGMIELWKATGCPLDLTVQCNFREWSKVIGGILQVNGFADFLGNRLESKVEKFTWLHVGSALPQEPGAYGAESALLIHVNDLRGQSNDRCEDDCPGRFGPAHSHFLLNIGQGLLGSLEAFATANAEQSIRTYEFCIDGAQARKGRLPDQRRHRLP